MVDRYRLVFLAALLVTAAIWHSSRAETAGTVIAVRVWAYGTPDGDPARHDLFLEDDVYTRERLETVESGALHVHLMDDTMLRLGSATSVVVDEFVYSPDSDTTTLLANMGKGVCRFITGKTARKDVKVSTPAATIAARGTDFSVRLKPDGSATVWVQSGQVEVIPRDGTAPALVNEGEIVFAPIAGGGIHLDAPREATDTGLADTTHVLIPRRKSMR
jgi:hypothetical protein